MLATMQRMVHKLTRSRGAPAQAKVIAKLVGMRRRYVWAQAVQQLKMFLSDPTAHRCLAVPRSSPGGPPYSCSGALLHIQNPAVGHPVSPNPNVGARR
jgi:hypothetical protein